MAGPRESPGFRTSGPGPAGAAWRDEDRVKPLAGGRQGDTPLFRLAVGSPPSHKASDGPLGDRPGLAREGTAGRPAAETLLAKAQELASDLLVMGAHSRTRLREMILVSCL